MVIIIFSLAVLIREKDSGHLEKSELILEIPPNIMWMDGILQFNSRLH